MPKDMGKRESVPPPQLEKGGEDLFGGGAEGLGSWEGPHLEREGEVQGRRRGGRKGKSCVGKKKLAKN